MSIASTNVRALGVCGIAAVAGLPLGAQAQWSTSGANIFSGNTGNVGVGTSSPLHKLHILTGLGDRAIYAEQTDLTLVRFGGFFKSLSTTGRGVAGLASAGTGQT